MQKWDKEQKPETAAMKQEWIQQDVTKSRVLYSYANDRTYAS
jgi:hypothetical protein